MRYTCFRYDLLSGAVLGKISASAQEALACQVPDEGEGLMISEDPAWLALKLERMMYEWRIDVPLLIPVRKPLATLSADKETFIADGIDVCTITVQDFKGADETLYITQGRIRQSVVVTQTDSIVLLTSEKVGKFTLEFFPTARVYAAPLTVLALPG